MRLIPGRRGKQRARRSPRLSTGEEPPNEYFSYHSSRLPGGSSDRSGSKTRTPDNNRFSKLRRLYRPIILVAILFALIYTNLVNTKVQVALISNTSDDHVLRSTETYQAAAKKILDKSIFSHTKLTINTTNLTIQMKQQFPELQDVVVTLPLVDHRPLVQLIARRPGILITSRQGTYGLDTNGIAMIQGKDVDGLANLKLIKVTDETDLPIKLGNGILTSQEVTYIQVLIAQLEANKMVIESVSLPSAVNELHVKVSGQPFYVKFDMQNDPRTSAGAFLATLNQLNQDHTVPSQYIDVRLEDRVYVK